jgi:hypothetical protein
MPDPESTLRGFIDAFSTHHEDAMRAVLAPDLTAYVTDAEGGVQPVLSRDSYVQRLLALKAPVFTVKVTQSVTTRPDQALLMVEIHAERKDRALHNFAAFLATVRDEQIAELWMVEALPAYSDQFWR